MTELGKLIDAAARANHGRSQQEAADLATSRGAPISKSLISENSRAVETITSKAIRGIAAGYDIPEEDVARAMLADLGFVIGDYNPGVEAALRRDADLSTDARAILLAAIGAARVSTRRTIADVPAVADEAQDSSAYGAWFAGGEEPGVLGDENGDQRHQRGS